MSYRQDKRTKQQFKDDIFNAHYIQRICIHTFVKELEYRGFFVEYKDTGTDNSGEYVVRPTAEPDYSMYVSSKIGYSEFSLEIKTAPHHNFWTIKLDSINALIYYDAYCLIVSDINTRAKSFDDIGLGKAVWTVFSPETAAKLLLHFPVKSFANIYGGKPSIQIPKSQIENWFILDKFSHHPKE